MKKNPSQGFIRIRNSKTPKMRTFHRNNYINQNLNWMNRKLEKNFVPKVHLETQFNIAKSMKNLNNFDQGLLEGRISNAMNRDRLTKHKRRNSRIYPGKIRKMNSEAFEKTTIRQKMQLK